MVVRFYDARVVVPAVWLHAMRSPRGRAGRLAACARARVVVRCGRREVVLAVRLHSGASNVRAAHVRARFMCTRRTFAFNLEHHAILFPQTPAASVWSFTAAALEGALTGAL